MKCYLAVTILLKLYLLLQAHSLLALESTHYDSSSSSSDERKWDNTNYQADGQDVSSLVPSQYAVPGNGRLVPRLVHALDAKLLQPVKHAPEKRRFGSYIQQKMAQYYIDEMIRKHGDLSFLPRSYITKLMPPAGYRSSFVAAKGKRASPGELLARLAVRPRDFMDFEIKAVPARDARKISQNDMFNVITLNLYKVLLKKPTSRLSIFFDAVRRDKNRERTQIRIV